MTRTEHDRRHRALMELVEAGNALTNSHLSVRAAERRWSWVKNRIAWWGSTDDPWWESRKKKAKAP